MVDAVICLRSMGFVVIRRPSLSSLGGTSAVMQKGMMLRSFCRMTPGGGIPTVFISTGKDLAWSL